MFMLQCKTNEFGCNDGSCIPIWQRCNELQDCQDASDELGCTTVAIDEGKYRREKPPVQLSGKPTSVKADIWVLSLSSFRELEMTFKVRIKITLTWLDNRLEFLNLKEENEGVNMIGKEEGNKVNN